MRAYKANMIPGGVTPTINVSQYDNDYAVTVTLIEGAEIYTPPVGATIRVEGTKPDGHGFEYACTYQGNVVTMPIYTQMTVVAGRFPIELVVYQSGLRVGSCNIVFAVEKAPLGEDTDISETVIPDIIAGAQAQAEAAAASAASAAEAAAQVLSSQIVTEASGTVASFSDGADDVAVKSLVASITPVQNLNGQANPYPPGGGKNLVNATVRDATTINGITSQVYDNNRVTISGTSTGSGDAVINVTPFTVPAGTAITFSMTSTGTRSLSLYVFLGSGATQIGNIAVGNKSITYTTTEELTTSSIRLRTFNGGTVSLDAQIQIEIGSTATAYAPYENICPISGRTGMTVTRAGKNLFDGVFSQQNPNQIQSSTITLPTGTYTYSQKYNGTPTWGVYVQRLDNTEIARVYNANKVTFTLSQEESVTIRVYYGNGITPANITEAQIEIGSTATPYTPYVASTTYPITWQTEAGTVYGGTLDVVSGVLTVEYGAITFDGTQTLTDRISSADRAYMQITGMATHAMLNDPFAICNRLPKASAMQNADHACVCIGHDTTGNYIYLQGVSYLSGVTNLATLNAWLADNPVVCTYELATPQTYQLTPTEVRTLLGGNTIYTDAGSVSVEYIADTKLYIDNKIAALQALILEN